MAMKQPTCRTSGCRNRPTKQDKVVPLRPKAQPGDGSRQGQPVAMTEVQEHGGVGHGAAGGESTTRMAVVFGILLLLLVFAFVLLR